MRDKYINKNFMKLEARLMKKKKKRKERSQEEQQITLKIFQNIGSLIII